MSAPTYSDEQHSDEEKALLHATKAAFHLIYAGQHDSAAVVLQEATKCYREAKFDQ